MFVPVLLEKVYLSKCCKNGFSFCIIIIKDLLSFYFGKTTRLFELKIDFHRTNSHCLFVCCVVCVNCYEQSHSNGVVYFNPWFHMNTFMRRCTRLINFVCCSTCVRRTLHHTFIRICTLYREHSTHMHMLRTIDFNFTNMTKITSVEQLKYMMMMMACVYVCVCTVSLSPYTRCRLSTHS